MKSQKLFSKYFLITALWLGFTSCDNSHYQYSPDPEPGIFLSFDDYCVDEWYRLRDMFLQYDAHVTFYVTKFDTLTEDQIWLLKVLQKDGHEIGFHGAHHILSEYYIEDHSLKEYLKYEIATGLDTMNNHDFFPTSFAYPYSAKYWGTDRELLKYFHTVRSSLPFKGELENMEDVFYQFDGSRLLYAVSIDEGKGLDLQQIEKAIQKAKRDKSVLMLHGHEPGTDFDQKFLAEILQLAKKHQLKFFRATDLVK
jgi:peptidoglycan/xylan/chitin deacetylase (PgdA/CDA1 family)